jgi:hypothetical protein
MAVDAPFPAAPPLSVPIRELGLTIEGSPLEPVLAEFEKELERAGITRLRPDFYLSTEWGVPFPSVSIGIPFYLARPELTEVHAGHGEYLEGAGKEDLLRFLRHEMGHVINYAYRLYEREDWVKQFGSMTQPYLEEYRPEPFSRRHVRHLPGWYAQKHPDEDWAETFAVWMTPGLDWRPAYRDSPQALAKLKYCDRVMRELNRSDPLTTAIDHDEDVSELQSSLEEFYRKAMSSGKDPLPPGLDGALQAIFEDYVKGDGQSVETQTRPAEQFIRRMERELMTNVYRWTGHFPEETRRLVRHLARRAKELGQCYPSNREAEVTIAFTTLVTSLAMNHVLRGHYLP